MAPTEKMLATSLDQYKVYRHVLQQAREERVAELLEGRTTLRQRTHAKNQRQQHRQLQRTDAQRVATTISVWPFTFSDIRRQLTLCLSQQLVQLLHARSQMSKVSVTAVSQSGCTSFTLPACQCCVLSVGGGGASLSNGVKHMKKRSRKAIAFPGSDERSEYSSVADLQVAQEDLES